jgi:hypothetical protein
VVDFNSEATIARSKAEIEGFSILEKRAFVIDAIEDYEKKLGGGVSPHPQYVRARLIALFWQVRAMLKRKDKKRHDVLWIGVKSKNYPELEVAFDDLSDYLDSLKLTQIDTGKVYDSSRVEEENRAKNL